MKVSLFITCFNDALFPETGQAVVRLLERLWRQVESPPCKRPPAPQLYTSSR